MEGSQNQDTGALTLSALTPCAQRSFTIKPNAVVIWGLVHTDTGARGPIRPQPGTGEAPATTAIRAVVLINVTHKCDSNQHCARGLIHIYLHLKAMG